MESHDPFPRAIRLPFVLLVVLMLAASLTGGSNRGDVLAVMLVRLAAVVCVGAAIARSPLQQLRVAKTPLILLAVLALWMLVQVVPLPPVIWTALPGRERLAEMAGVIGTSQPWMPISIVPTRTLNSLAALLVPAAALVMVAWLPRSTWTLQVRILVGIGLASALLALIQISGPTDSVWYLYDVRQKGGAVGFFANRNHQAVLLACMFPMLALIGMQAAQTRGRGLALTLSCVAVAIFLLPLIFITGSRGGLLVSGVSLAATAALIWPSVYRSNIPRWWLAAAGAIAAIAAAGFAAILLSGRSLALQRLTETDVSEEQRVLVVEPILRLIRANLPIGTGFGTFDPAFRAIEPYSQLFRTYLNHAHSDPLEFVSDGGIPAALILVVFLLWWARATMIIWKRPTIGNAARTASIVTALLMLASLVDYPLRTPLAAMIFAILVGWMAKALADRDVVDGDVIESGGRRSRDRKSRGHRERR